MKFFVKGVKCGIWKVVKEGLFVPTHKFNSVVETKPEKDWTKDDK